MEDRIQINGEWYVKETTPEESVINLTYFQSCVYEPTKKYCFEATRLYNDYKTSEFFEGDIDIKFTDKSTWLLAVHHDNRDALEEAFELMDNDGVRELKDFIRELIKIGWIKY